MFYSSGPIFCPNCIPVFHRKNPEKQIGVTTKLLDNNYSGTGVDIVECPECHKIFQVSYKVDKIIPWNSE